MPYNIAVNNGGARTGRIRVAWTGGGATYIVNQAGIPFVASFTMVDPFGSVNVATECQFRASSTPWGEGNQPALTVRLFTCGT